jgi:DegV family protein with EDD domain
VIHVVVDSTADLPEATQREFGISVVPILIQFGRETLRDTEISHDEFYRRLTGQHSIPTTAAPPVGLFEEVFRSLTANGDSVLSISVGGDLSSTYSAAQQGARLVEGAQIVCVDSRTTITPMGFIAVAAARAAREGKSMDEIVAMIEQLKRRVVLLVALDTLRYLERGGRIGKMQAFLGTMLSVKPVLEVRDSAVLPVEQVRTSKRVPSRLVELATSRGAYRDLSIVYTTNHAGAESLADLCAQATTMPREQIQIVQAGPALGTHVGPGALGIAGILA